MNVVTDARRARFAYETIKAQLERDGERFNRSIGYPGGSKPNLDLYWHSRDAIWCHLNDGVVDNRYWVCFGDARPERRISHSIVVELNAPFEGVNRRTAGVFLQDGADVFIGHTGKVGGGKKGVGKTQFMSWYDGVTERIQWPDGKESEVIVIGRVDSDELRSQVARFVHRVAEFKAKGGVHAIPHGASSPSPEIFFKPKFRGKKRRAGQKDVDVYCSHGVVVDALRAAFSSGYTTGNDRQRDLICVSSSRRPVALFEVKTAANTSSIYAAVGQLMLHSTGRETLVLVAPDEPVTTLASALKRLGIHVLTYELSDGVVRFDGLEEVRELLARAARKR